MREELVTPAIARRLAQEGLAWEPQVGDWLMTLGGSEGDASLWLVVATLPEQGLLTLANANGRWPQAQVAARDCLWLPTAGKLKTWLRAQGLRVTTGEASTRPSGGPLDWSGMTLHVCRLTSPADSALVIDGEGASEAEAVAVAALRVLGRFQAAARDPWPGVG
ncbi:MAG TPA: hypothetical protein VKQ36_14705 [Ktedonobacterales bacterium]|nr:hypothetical protein [Ktedonobacterales bacterium]